MKKKKKKKKKEEEEEIIDRLFSISRLSGGLSYENIPSEPVHNIIRYIFCWYFFCSSKYDIETNILQGAAQRTQWRPGCPRTEGILRH
jgi:hypothetical protein